MNRVQTVQPLRSFQAVQAATLILKKRNCRVPQTIEVERNDSLPRIETVSQFRSWFDKLTTNGIAESRNQPVTRSP